MSVRKIPTLTAGARVFMPALPTPRRGQSSPTRFGYGRVFGVDGDYAAVAWDIGDRSIEAIAELDPGLLAPDEERSRDGR